jgi:putative tricarboxylic transport membrane protein
MGTLVGVLPGIGPTATIALLLPATFKLNPISAIIMLSGICYGAMYGGSTTSILLNIPGEASSVVTCFDGYRMARPGRAGAALGISAFGSFIAGTISIFGLILLAPTLAEFALKFGPPEYFALMVMGLTVVAYLARKSMAKALMMAVVGSFLGRDRQHVHRQLYAFDTQLAVDPLVGPRIENPLLLSFDLYHPVLLDRRL